MHDLMTIRSVNMHLLDELNNLQNLDLTVHFEMKVA